YYERLDQTTIKDLMQSEDTFDRLRSKTGLVGIPREAFVKLVRIQQRPESRFIDIKLYWEDAKEGADIVNTLVKISQEKVREQRQLALGTPLATAQKRLAEADKALQEALAARDRLLRAHHVTNLQFQLPEASRLSEEWGREFGAAKRELEKIQADIARLQKEIA